MEKKEEININEPKVFTNKPVAKKQPTKKKPEKKDVEKPVEEIREVYQYKGEGELIMDKPSQPVIPVVIEQKVFSNKETFESLAKEGKGFTLKYMGAVIYDSDGTISKTFHDLSFAEDYFILYGKSYSYDGLNFKFKK